MRIMTSDELQQAIKKYRDKHKRYEIVNFEGEPKEYPVEQLGLDIIDALEKRIKELEQSISPY